MLVLAWLRAPGPGKSGTKNIARASKTVWDSKLGLEIKKSLGFKTLFGNQKNVWGSKLGPVTLCVDIRALEVVACSSRASYSVAQSSRAWKVWGQEHFKRMKHSLGFRTWFGNQKMFGGQNFVWRSKKCLGFKTWSGDFGFETCALELIALLSGT